ncbi:MAG: response regulator [Alphaproteobacteria bacterium]|nr:MAG: response regulator [Alphaproteobacteria bacterium]
MALSANLKILIVDDSEISIGIVKGVLKRKGFKQILTSYNGDEAKQILQAEYDTGNPVELILSDWEMPRLKGIDLLNFVRQSNIFAHIPFIMITVNNDIEHVAEAISLGISSYIVKPINVEVLMRKISDSIKS